MYTPEKISATNKAGVEAMLAVANANFAALEKLTALNLESAKESIIDAGEHLKALFDAKDPQEVSKLASAYAQPALAKAVAYSKNVYDVASQTQSSITQLLESQASELNRSMSSMMA